MWRARLQLDIESEEWRTASMEWNQWSRMYPRGVATQATLAGPPVSNMADPRRRVASLPLVPCPVYPMGRFGHHFQHLPVVRARPMVALPSHRDVYPECAVTRMGLNEASAVHKHQIAVAPRLHTEEQRHPILSQYPVQPLVNEDMASSSGGDHEMSEEDAAAVAVAAAIASEEDSGSSSGSSSGSMSSSSSSSTENLNDERFVRGQNSPQSLNAVQETQKTSKLTDGTDQSCHVCGHTLFSQTARSELYVHSSYGSDAVRCTNCDFSKTEQGADGRNLRPEHAQREEEKRLDSLSQPPSDSTEADDVHASVDKKSRQSNPKCAYCERRFLSRAIRDQHARKCDGNPYRCAQCGKACLGRVKLERHMRSHSRSRLSTLKAQEMAKNKQGKAPDPKCAYCQTRFPTRVVRDRHSRLCPSNPYKCPQCSKAFLGMAKLERHVRTHSEVRAGQTTAASTLQRSSIETQSGAVQMTGENISLKTQPSNSKARSHSHSIESILHLDGSRK